MTGLMLEFTMVFIQRSLWMLRLMVVGSPLVVKAVAMVVVRLVFFLVSSPMMMVPLPVWVTVPGWWMRAPWVMTPAMS